MTVVPLRSQLFRSDPRLQACLVEDRWHVTPGSTGDNVHRIQVALMQIDGLRIDPGELRMKWYGASTAAAVLQFKQNRDIVNRTYQTQADDIVGKMTIAALDEEMLRLELRKKIKSETFVCSFDR
jgi:hypothetical protein